MYISIDRGRVKILYFSVRYFAAETAAALAVGSPASARCASTVCKR